MEDIAFKGDDVVDRNQDDYGDDPTGRQSSAFMLVIGGLALLAVVAAIFFVTV